MAEFEHLDFPEMKGPATRLWARRSRLSQLRVKWLVTGSWESTETWIRNSIHEASRRISDSSHLLSTRPPRSLPTCYTSVSLRPTSKQMCPLAVYGPQATKLKKVRKSRNRLNVAIAREYVVRTWDSVVHGNS